MNQKHDEAMRNFIIADNQDLTRHGLDALVRQDSQNCVCRAMDKAGLIQLLKEHESAVVILDYTLFDFADVEQLLIISERYEMARWILISNELTPAFLKKVIYTSRLFSIVYKDSPVAEIREALQAAVRHQRFICQRALEEIIVHQQEVNQPSPLTSTEQEIVKAIAMGKSTKEIAAERYSSVHTITTHRKNIFRKLGINTAHEAIKYALRAGLVDSTEFYI
jgi:DNA-binding NarL/FixJ family response regulator